MINEKKIYKVTNGVREELTALEYEQVKADLLNVEKEKQTRQTYENLKISAETKLKNLGLTDDEVKAFQNKNLEE
jgi:hypothetical protein